MNGYELEHAFWNANAEERFTPCECQFFFYLLHLANLRRWKFPIRCPTAEFCHVLCMSKQNVSKVRISLERRGIITFVAGIGKGNPPLYTFIDTKSTSLWSHELSVELSHNKNRKDKESIISQSAMQGLIPLEELREQLKNDGEWHTKLAECLGYPEHQFKKEFLPYLEEFFVFLAAQGHKEREVIDCKSHFLSWLKKKLQNIKRYGFQSNIQTQRRSTPVCITSEAGYEGDF